MWESLQMEKNSSATREVGMWKRTTISVSVLSAEIKI